MERLTEREIESLRCIGNEYREVFRAADALTQAYAQLAALDLLEKLRQEHNGIFVISVYLGHDGDNTVELRSYDRELGRGNSGTGLWDAAWKAVSDWRWRSLTGENGIENNEVLEAIERAIKDFRDSDNAGTFNSADFYHFINEGASVKITQTQAIELLSRSLRVVQLFGGAHWLLLPDGMTRYEGTPCSTS